MRKRGDIAVDIISRIDDDVVEKNLIKRFELWFSRGKKPKHNKWMPIIASAACFLLVATTVFLLWPDAPVDERQAPIYLGMTVSNDAPATDSASAHELSPIALGADSSMLTPMYLDNTNYEDNNGNHGDKDHDNNNGTTTPPEISGGPYYAMPGEDIYIHVHISNPDEFEILSFTLNEVKYSAYMFEEGSDLETLILKCNVGELEGVMQYTIDAIKYVDGEEIKDVKMQGDRTIEVMVGQAADTYLGFNISLTGFDVNVEEIWKDGFEGEREILSLGVYNGTTLIRELAPTDRVIKGLPSNSRFVLVATYKNGEATETARQIFDTRKLSEGLQMTSGHITGIGTCQDTVLYIDAPIGENAFAGNKYITEVHFGPNVTLIDNGAFSGCVGLTDITIPETVLKIENVAFEGCSNVNTATVPAHAILPLPKGNLNSVVITSGDIPQQAFAGCSALNSVTICEGVTGIGSFAFDQCSSLTSIAIPASVTHIGVAAFGNIDIELDTENTSYNLVDNCLIENVTNKLIWAYGESIEIPFGVERIGSHAFVNCKALTSIIMPDTVTSIGASAFSGCSGLTSISIPNGITRIEDSTFKGCSGLTSITIPDSVTSIGVNAFDGCINITSVTAPLYSMKYIPKDNLSNTVITGGTSIGDSEFSGCTGLTSITIPDGVTSIGANAFSGCTGLTSITIPNSVTSIGDGAFRGCMNLQISIDVQNPIYRIEDNCLIERQTNKLIFCGNDGAIPSGVASIVDYACADIKDLTSVTIPHSVTSIGNNAFSGCTGLTSVTIPNSVTSIGNGAFHGCVNIKTAKMPKLAIPYIPQNSLETVEITNGERLENREFASCTTLKNVILADSITYVDDFVFDPSGALSEAVHIKNISASHKALIYLQSKRGVETLTVSSGVIDSFGGAYWPSLTTLIISNNVTAITSLGYVPNSTTVIYTGTKDEWNALSKSNGWNNNLSVTEVQCTDGTVAIG